MSIITSHSHWVLRHAIELDREAPFCGEFFRMSSERQHVVAAYLCARGRTAVESGKLADFLLRAGHNKILAAAFGSVPRGMRRALGRSGAVVHSERFYSLLHELLARDDTDIARCIGQTPRLDLDTLGAIAALPPAACSASLVQSVMGEAEAKDVATAFSVLTENGVDKNWLTRSLREVKTQSALSALFQRAARRAKAPAHPVPASDFYQPIQTGEELFAVAHEFRNCLRNYTCSFLDEGQGNAFAVVSRGEHRTVVHLVRGMSGWKLEGLFKPRNRRPSRPTRDWIESYLQQHGVMVEGRGPRQPSRWDSLHNIICGDLLDFHLGFDIQELDEMS